MTSSASATPLSPRAAKIRAELNARAAAKAANATPKRLGVLAIGCADGSVRLVKLVSATLSSVDAPPPEGFEDEWVGSTAAAFPACKARLGSHTGPHTTAFAR